MITGAQADAATDEGAWDDSDSDGGNCMHETELNGVGLKVRLLVRQSMSDTVDTVANTTRYNTLCCAVLRCAALCYAVCCLIPITDADAHEDKEDSGEDWDAGDSD